MVEPTCVLKAQQCAWGNTYEQLMIARGKLNHAWESTLEEHFDLSMLDQDRIRFAINTAVQNRRIPAQALENGIENILMHYKLLHSGKLTRAAMILFGLEPENHFPQCVIKMARFKGSDKFGDFIDSQKVFGNVFNLLDAADNFLSRHLPIASFFDDNRFTRLDRSKLPVFPVREALINAICHRDYSERSGSISLAIYDDRLEIWSNGLLPPNLCVEDLQKEHESWPQNPIIAHIFYTMGLNESWGRGTNRMIEVCQEYGLPPPQFKELSGGIGVTFPFASDIGKLDSLGRNNVESRKKAILSLLHASTLSANDIHHKLPHPPSLRTIKADLSTLQKNGLVEQVGRGKNTLWQKCG